MSVMMHRGAGNDLELQTIYEISKVLCSSLDLKATLSEVLKLLSSCLQMERGMICLLGDDDYLQMVAGHGVPKTALEKARFKIGEGIVGQIVKNGMSAVVPNLADEPLFLNRTQSRGDFAEGVISLVGVPIKEGGKSIGVLTIDRVSADDRPRNFNSDVRFLTMTANLIAQTVRMHQDVAEERRQIIQNKYKHDHKPEETYNTSNIIGSSEAMRQVLTHVRQVAPYKSTVLIRGESGTGKELIARAIHDHSGRKEHAFVRVNCAALPEGLLESELFGHEKGAFTGANREHKGRFERANGGTLFLDEIGDISASFQAKLLRVLQEQEFERVGGHKTMRSDVRIIAATNVNLEEAVSQGRFRADLYYRINVVPISLPPLRERKSDIADLALHFINHFNQENGREIALTVDALDVMKDCFWPGNVRELENCINRAATLCKDGQVTGTDFSCTSNQCYSATLYRHITEKAGGTGSTAVPQMEPNSHGFGSFAAGAGAFPAPATAFPATAAPNTIPRDSIPARASAPAHVGGGETAVPPTAPPCCTPGGEALPCAKEGSCSTVLNGQRPAGVVPPSATDFSGLSSANDMIANEESPRLLEPLPPGHFNLAAEDAKDMLIQAMIQSGWVQAKAARLLGLTPRQIGYALRKHDIELKHL